MGINSALMKSLTCRVHYRCLKSKNLLKGTILADRITINEGRLTAKALKNFDAPEKFPK